MVSVFIQRDINSFIYINQFKGFINSDNPDYVLKLNKALYGLKQSVRIWYYTLKEKFINKLSFIIL